MKKLLSIFIFLSLITAPVFANKPFNNKQNAREDNKTIAENTKAENRLEKQELKDVKKARNKSVKRENRNFKERDLQRKNKIRSHENNRNKINAENKIRIQQKNQKKKFNGIEKRPVVNNNIYQNNKNSKDNFTNKKPYYKRDTNMRHLNNNQIIINTKSPDKRYKKKYKRPEQKKALYISHPIITVSSRPLYRRYPKPIRDRNVNLFDILNPFFLLGNVSFSYYSDSFSLYCGHHNSRLIIYPNRYRTNNTYNIYNNIYETPEPEINYYNVKEYKEEEDISASSLKDIYLQNVILRQDPIPTVTMAILNDTKYNIASINFRLNFRTEEGTKTSEEISYSFEKKCIEPSEKRYFKLNLDNLNIPKYFAVYATLESIETSDGIIINE